MRKYTFLLTLLTVILFHGFTFAQPRTGNKHIYIETILIDSKQIFIKGNGSIQNNTICLKDKSGRQSISITTSKKGSEKYYNFIYKSDTMRVSMKYEIIDDLQLTIKNFNFLKGNYNIDLYHYIKEKTKKMHEIKLPFVIENFPNDCMDYRIIQ